MRVLYQIPSLHTIYAGRTIYHGYKNAFEDLGHTFRPLIADDDFRRVCEQYEPDLFITSLNRYYVRFLDLDVIRERRRGGMKVLVNVPFWKSPMSSADSARLFWSNIQHQGSNVASSQP